MPTPINGEKILNEGDYTIGIFVSELEKADSTGLDEWLMMEAVTEISGINDMFYTNKDDFFACVQHLRMVKAKIVSVKCLCTDLR